MLEGVVSGFVNACCFKWSLFRERTRCNHPGRTGGVVGVVEDDVVLLGITPGQPTQMHEGP